MSETQSKPLVLFVDDVPDIREFMGVWARKFPLPFDAAFAENRESALRVIRERRPAAVVLDVNLSGETGISIAEDLRDGYPEIAKAVLTAYGLAMTRESAEELGMDVWSKPITMPELIEKVKALLAARPGAERQSTLEHVSNVVKVLAATIGLLTGAHVHKVY